jgi:WD40 repeat protein
MKTIQQKTTQTIIAITSMKHPSLSLISRFVSFAALAVSAGLLLAQPCASASGTFVNTGSLAVGHDSHTATLLPNGKVLVAGGVNGPGDQTASASAELYDPASGTWTATGSLVTARYVHTATLLSNGKVLVAAGFSDTSGYLASAELYDPASGTWTATGSLATARFFPTATLLPNGKVLVTGGYNDSSPALASAELYDPASGTWTATGSLATARFFQTATLLPNGKVLVAGGNDGNGGPALASAELYDPASGTWTATGSLATARALQTATLLPNGKVLVAGGRSSGVRFASAELYDPASGTWTATGSLGAARVRQTATLLPNGQVLVTGGVNSSGVASASAELYDPASGSWTATGSLVAARIDHTATLLSNGQVLVAGGNDGSNALASAELYAPQPSVVSPGPYEVLVSSPSGTPHPGDPVVVFPDAKNNPSQHNLLTSNLPTDASPGTVAFGGADIALITDIFNSRVYVVQISTAALQGTIDISSVSAHHELAPIAVAPGFGEALIAGSNGVGSTLGVIHAPFNSSSTLTTVALPGNATTASRTIAFAANGRAFIYTPASNISVSDPPYASIAFSIPITTFGAMAISPDGNTLLVTDGRSNRIAIYQAPLSASSTPSTLTVTAAQNLAPIAITPDGTTALVCSVRDDKAFAIAAPFSSSSAIETLPLPSHDSAAPGASAIAISADSQFAIVGGASSIAQLSNLVTLRAPFTAAGVQAAVTTYQTSELPYIAFPPPVASPTAQLLNIATRLKVLNGDNVLIGGFIITGTDPKKVLILGIGPSLAQFFSGSLSDPTLELYQGDTLLQMNDNWKSDQQAEVEATGIPPSNDLESAIVRTLDPGSYTAILRGKGDATGIGVVQAYDLNQAANSKFGNIATRGFVDSGDNAMIGGFIIGPTNGGSTTVVVRAIGPSLANFGVSGALPDPTVELHDGNGATIAFNDNWADDANQGSIPPSLQPGDPHESALYRVLPPGDYTAIMRGAGNSTGIGLVEVYNVQ